MQTKPDAVCLIGPTASGKTALALQLAQHIPLEVISVDSALVYRGMDIGSAKPNADELAQVPHHLIDIIEPTAVYSAANFCQDARRLIGEIRARGKLPLLVGGTMLYIKALENGLSELPSAEQNIREQLNAEAALKGWAAMHAKLLAIDPISARRLAANDAQRIQRALEVYLISGKTMSELLASSPQKTSLNLCKFALIPSDRSALHQRINERFKLILQAGLLEELRRLQEKYPELNSETPSMRSVGYRQAWQFLAGNISQAELIDQASAATRQLAKRQLTWLRAMPDLTVFDCLEPAQSIGKKIIFAIQENICSAKKV